MASTRQSQVWQVLALTFASFGCDPIRSVGVFGRLSQTMNDDCILQALRSAEGIQNVSVYPSSSRKVWNSRDGAHEEISPTQYLAVSNRQVGDHQLSALISQTEDKYGTVRFGSNTNWLGWPFPSVEVQEQTQALGAYLARHIGERCDAKYVEGRAFECRPESKLCEEALSDVGAK